MISNYRLNGVQFLKRHQEQGLRVCASGALTGSGIIAVGMSHLHEL